MFQPENYCQLKQRTTYFFGFMPWKFKWKKSCLQANIFPIAICLTWTATSVSKILHWLFKTIRVTFCDPQNYWAPTTVVSVYLGKPTRCFNTINICLHFNSSLNANFTETKIVNCHEVWVTFLLAAKVGQSCSWQLSPKTCPKPFSKALFFFVVINDCALLHCKTHRKR